MAESAGARGTCLLWPCSYPFPPDYVGFVKASLRHWTTTGTVFCAAFGLQCDCCHGRPLDSILPFHI